MCRALPCRLLQCRRPDQGLGFPRRILGLIVGIVLWRAHPDRPPLRICVHIGFARSNSGFSTRRRARGRRTDTRAEGRQFSRDGPWIRNRAFACKAGPRRRQADEARHASSCSRSGLEGDRMAGQRKTRTSREQPGMFRSGGSREGVFRMACLLPAWRHGSPDRHPHQGKASAI